MSTTLTIGPSGESRDGLKIRVYRVRLTARAQKLDKLTRPPSPAAVRAARKFYREQRLAGVSKLEARAEVRAAVAEAFEQAAQLRGAVVS